MTCNKQDLKIWATNEYIKNKNPPNAKISKHNPKGLRPFQIQIPPRDSKWIIKVTEEKKKKKKFY